MFARNSADHCFSYLGVEGSCVGGKHKEMESLLSWAAMQRAVMRLKKGLLCLWGVEEELLQLIARLWTAI